MSLLKCRLLRKACSDQLETATPSLPGTAYPFHTSLFFPYLLSTSNTLCTLILYYVCSLILPLGSELHEGRDYAWFVLCRIPSTCMGPAVWCASLCQWPNGSRELPLSGRRKIWEATSQLTSACCRGTNAQFYFPVMARRVLAYNGHSI